MHVDAQLTGASNVKAVIVLGMQIVFLWGENKIRKKLIKQRHPLTVTNSPLSIVLK
jgi:hypothetical protein